MAAGNVLDVFNSDAFGMVSMADGIDKITIQPSRIMGMGLFRAQGVMTKFVKIEERHGKLTLVPTAVRGTMPEFDTERPRTAKVFEVPHLPKNDTVWAEDVEGVREFDTSNKLETVSRIVADRLEQLKIDQEATWEWHAAKCLSGVVLDADGTALKNWFTEFGLTKKTVTISAADLDSPKQISMVIRRHIQDAIGGESFSGIHAFCNAAFMDSYSTHIGIKEAYARWLDGQFLRENQAYNFFDIHDIRWEEYRNVRTIAADSTTDIDIPYIDNPSTPGDPVAYAFPIGTRNVFRRYNAPSPFIETVNTMGRELYVKQVRNEWGTGQKLHTSSNPLFITQRPAAIVEVLLGA